MAAKTKPASRFSVQPILLSLFLISLWPVAAGAGQTSTQVPTSGTSRSTLPGLGSEDPAMKGPDPLRLQKMMEDDRRKRLLSDTARLVALSNELQTEVQKSSRDELSLEVVRKAAELEKLAHDVKERMKS